ncbi:glycoside hydrolase family 3 C-terminal domain-containing protein [Caulobacter sp.]|uniref:glycoside hydrolase family 3 C-terminal domain-containing protein n=1 Tax=Caulobacter sp. TaxID=78 RepID=UPI001B2EAB3C|nr:glycoside hydrolase family 3 C-terminal domain-containing protein [Caulobacter sp.]MBO9545010.1 glycoside hydrolase family 3 C-terminal domain-containing protein [Caulobacter sp.]
MLRTNWRRCALATALCAALSVGATSVQAAPAGTVDRAKADRLATELVGKMTVDEKVEQLLNVAPAIPRLGIPAYNWWTESLHGALGTLPTTNFPEPVGLAATFDPALVHDVAGAIGTEMRDLHTLARATGRMGRIGTGLNTWSPNINIFRDPRWGRGQETYGEDPYLTARMGVSFVQGIQGDNPDNPLIIATPKHYAVHSGPESTRHSANVFVSRHDLEDTYLPAFRAAVVDGKAGSIMCAYNRIDGQPACASDLLLKDHLRDAWKFNGYVVSDCDAVKDIADHHKYAPDAAAAVAASLRAGVDNECNGATLTDTDGLAHRYSEALDRGLITIGEIDTALVRLFSARLRNGDLPANGGEAPRPLAPTTVMTPEHEALALAASEKSLVLLKNDGILPLRPGLRIAVIGPLGDATRVLRGNYSSALSAPPISVVDGLKRALPAAQVTYAPFGASFTDGDRVPTSALRTPDGKAGLLARYFNTVEPPPKRFAPGTFGDAVAKMTYAAKPVVTRIEADVASRSLDLADVSDHHRVVWTGFLVAPETGTYRLGLTGFNGEMKVDGKPFADLRKSGWASLPTMKTLRLEKGRKVAIEVSSESHALSGVSLVWKRIATDPTAELKAAAAKADVLVAVVGLTSDLEAEESPVEIPGFKGGDKTTLDIPADQQALLEQAKALGKPLIVVAMNGSPLNFSWAKDNAAALLEAWYPGQSGGLAIANVLTGKTNPAGRLPLTFYRSTDDLPSFDDYSMKGRTYRYFEGKPVYPFGFGLSYTRFDYSPLKLEPAAKGAGQGLKVTTTVRNTGAKAGDEVAQLYLNFPDTPGAPRLALRGFQRISLKPGETRSVTFSLSSRDLSSVDLDGARRVSAGRYQVSVGSGQPGTDVPSQSASFAVDDVVAVAK